MIHSISGRITYINKNVLHIDANGIEYALIISDNAAQYFLPKLHTENRILTYLHVTDRSMELYGFTNVSERTMFFSLLKVDGIGPKAAVKILSHTTAEKLLISLQTHDIKTLSKVPGVGTKKAGKILVTLENVFVPVKEQDSNATSSKNDIASALFAMGYEKSDVEKALSDVASEYEHSEDTHNNEAHILRKAILLLSKDNAL